MSFLDPQEYLLPKQVGNEFVRHYYRVLNKSPQLVYRLYGPDSFLKYNISMHAFGQEQIKTTIEKQRFKNVRGTITNLDCQNTWDNGVVIQVSGVLSNNGKPERQFAETFILAALSPRKYYILNHVFHYSRMNMDDEEKIEDDFSHNQPQYYTYETDVRREQQIQQSIAHAVAVADFSVPPPQLSFFDTCIAPVPPLSDHSMSSKQQEVLNQPLPNGAVTFEEFLMRIQDGNAALNASRSQHSILGSASFSEFTPQQVPTFAESFGSILEQQQQEEMEAANQQEQQERATYANLFKAGTPRTIDFLNATQQQQQQQQQHQHDNFLRQQMTNYHTGNSATFEQLFMPATSMGTFGDNFPMSMDHSMTPASHQRSNPGRMNNRTRSLRDNQQLFLGNIPHHASEDDLRLIFQRFGNIVELRVLSKQGPKGPQGQRNPLNYGFLTYEDEQSVQACLANCPIFFPENSTHGKKLNVEIKKPRNRNNDLQRNRGQISTMGDPNIINSPRNMNNGHPRQQQQQQNNGGNRMRRNNLGSGNFNRNENRGGQSRRGGGGTYNNRH